MTPADILHGFPRKIDLSLDRMRAALALLGDPHRRLPPVVHVAGTNGKGSTVAFVRAMVEAAGARAHVYTSPHLVRINERWRVAGALIDDDRLLSLALRVRAVAEVAPVTIFEAETLVAFLAFAETPADWTLLEVGLGGTLDATNVVEAPAVTIITPVDMDHREFLGDTLAAIAGEKAGILKPGVACVVGAQQDEALDVIERRAAGLSAPLRVMGRDWHVGVEDGRLTVETRDRLLDLPAPALPGRHQFDNAAVAAMATLHMGLHEDAIAAGVAKARWPARLQRLRTGVCARLAAEKACELWLDGGHNPHGAQAAAAHMAALSARDGKPLGLVCGMMGTKDANGFFSAFAPLAPRVVCVPVRSATGGMDPAALAAVARDHGLSAGVAEDPAAGVARLVEAIPGGRALVCGSLYLAGDVLSDAGEGDGAG